MHREHMCSPRGLSSQPPLGPWGLNSWLVSSLSLFSTNLTNYLIWKVSEMVTHVFPQGVSARNPL